MRSLLLLLLLTCSLSAQEKGKIGGFDDAAKKAPRDSSGAAPARGASVAAVSTESGGEFDIVAFFEFLEVTADIVQAAALVTSSVFLQAPGEDSLRYGGTFWTRGYAPYPYAIPETGVLSPRSARPYMLRFELERFSDFDGLTGLGGTLRGAVHPAFALEASFQDLTEKLTTRSDHIRFYRAGFNYHRIRAETALLWWGLGIKGMSATTVHSAGLDFHTGAEFYPAAPVSFRLEYSVGRINGNGLHEFTAGVRFHYERFAAAAGYRYYGIGGASLSGMTVGCTLHL